MQFVRRYRLEPEPHRPASRPKIKRRAWPRNQTQEPIPKYNDRDLHAEGEHRADRKRIKDDRITSKNDLIDITPPLSLATDKAKNQAKATLKRIPIREWSNRAGSFWWRGKLTSVTHRYAVIEPEDGGEVQKIRSTNSATTNSAFWRAGLTCRPSASSATQV